MTDSPTTPETKHQTPSREDVLKVVNSQYRQGAWLRRGLWLVLLAGLGSALFVWWQNATTEPTITFETAPVTRGTLEETVTATGTLSPVDAVELGAEVTGRLVKVTVDVNDRVEVGQVLAEIDSEQLSDRVKEASAQLRSSRANEQSAKATLAEAELKENRLRALFTKGLASPEEQETAQASTARAKASVAASSAQVTVARASLGAAQTALRKSTIVSPISGVVLARNVELGQTLTAGFQTPVLFTLARDLKQLELRVEVDEADIGKVQEGQSAVFSVDAHPDKPFHSIVSKLHNLPTAGETNSTVVTYSAVLSVNNDGRLLRPGMTATATITTRTFTDVLLVTTASLRFSPPQPSQRSGFLAFFRRRPSGPRPSFGEAGAARHQDKVWVTVDNTPHSVPVKIIATDGLHAAVEPVDGAPSERREGTPEHPPPVNASSERPTPKLPAPTELLLPGAETLVEVRELLAP